MEIHDRMNCENRNVKRKKVNKEGLKSDPIEKRCFFIGINIDMHHIQKPNKLNI
jgi:hypothetical protein